MSLTKSITTLLLMTDGVSDAKFETDYNLHQDAKWAELWDDINAHVRLQGDQSKNELLEWLNFWSTGNHDDRTIAILF